MQCEAGESSCTKVNVHASLEFHPASHLHFMSLLLLGLAHKTHIAWQQVLPQVESNELKSYGIFITFISGPHLFIANFIENSQIVRIDSKCIHDIKTSTTLPFFTTATKFHNICVILSKAFLGPRGPLVLPLVGPVPSRPSALKIWITYIQAYMPYES